MKKVSHGGGRSPALFWLSPTVAASSLIASLLLPQWRGPLVTVAGIVCLSFGFLQVRARSIAKSSETPANEPAPAEPFAFPEGPRE